jgi:hypothetical protein
MYGNAYTLGQWFAGNWWRLRWEPEIPNSRNNVDWRMSHCMAAAGEGFIWPNILFASDGESMAIATRPTPPVTNDTPIRYLNDITARVTAKEFERAVDLFMELVLTRLHSEKARDTALAQLWTEIQTERNDPKLKDWRRLEAICGYDPENAPPAIIELVANDQFHLGHKAVEEVAAHSRHQTAKDLTTIRDLAAAKGKPSGDGFQCRPIILPKKPSYKKSSRPWEKGMALAQITREEMGIGNEPVSNSHLAGALRTNKNVFSRSSSKALAPLPIAIRTLQGDNLNFYIGRQPATSRRFAASRLLGQWLDSQGQTERLIPIADPKTAQQQFQRAFAQEFLCPFEVLRDRLQTDYPSPERIEEAAEYFGVSPLLVRTTLVNKRELDRDALAWAD